MNELHFAYKIRQHLNRSLYELRPETIDRLAAARQNALAHQKQMVSQTVLATAGSFMKVRFDPLYVKKTLGAFALLVFAVCSTFWMADRRVAELSDIDSALLADELPISAFTDKGFNAWLKQGSSD